MITVGQEVITAKRDLTEIFPAEFTNRKLINEYIQYILNNFFEKSKEKLVSSFVGQVVENIDGTDTYIKEPTAERQLNQIIPVLKAGNEKITFSNYMADLHNEGCTIYDENKLLSSKYWSWCPPINADMFTNFVNYVWIGYPYEEDNILVLDAPFDVQEEIINSRVEEYTYKKYDPETGEEIESYTLKHGDIVVFPNDTGKRYNASPYKVISEDGNGNKNGLIKLKVLKVPLIIIAKQTNVVSDVLNQKNYHFEDEDRDVKIDFENGIRIRFLNDENEEYNNKSFIVQGVGESIELIDDSYNPYYSNGYADIEKIFDPDYFIMERGSIDGNDWSRLNRWASRRAIEYRPTVSSLEMNNSESSPLPHATKPIICFNKDIEMYNFGTFGRGDVKYALDLESSDINGSVESDWYNSPYIFNKGDNLLLLGNVGKNPIQLYKLDIIDSIIYLREIKNGRDGTSLTAQGDSVKVLNGVNKGKVLYYNGFEWVSGQTKNKLNQIPLFNLYDVDKVALNNPVNYPNSTFNGCSLFQYKQSETSIINDIDVDMPIEYDDEDVTNYHFEDTLITNKFYFTPENDYKREISGYRLYRNLKDDSYLNDWHLSSSTSSQYLKTRIEISYSSMLDGDGYYELNLAYTPKENSSKKSLIISVNDIEMAEKDIIKQEDPKDFKLKGINVGDIIIVKLLTDDVNGPLEEGYVYEYPLSLTVNQFNKDIDYVSFNDCFNQMIDIISNQTGLQGSPLGSNNYSSIVPDVSVGTKMVQTASSVVKSMVLTNNDETSIRASIAYAENAYSKFKQKFINLVEQAKIKGTILDENFEEYDTDHAAMDETIVSIIKRINIGKEGLLPFYNNGMMQLLENAYIPATPSYLGAANCYEPRVEIWKDYTLDEKPYVIIGHDGSLTRYTEDVKDLFLLRFEELIYQSIQNKFKDTKSGLNIYPYMYGKFRENTYSRQEILDAYSPLFQEWCNKQNITYIENDKFRYDSFDADPTCWKTWNYTGCLDKDGQPLYGSYRSVYMYYYDTYRPDTHPWEMLGFGDKPSWWEDEYGLEPYTSENIVMWNDIENGIIKKGPMAGEYQEFKRPGLVEKYLPVDGQGKLKNPIDAGILNDIPVIQMARKKWVIGDIGDLEFAYLQTSDSKFDIETVKYMLRPVEWLETNWNTVNREVIFHGTNYEQVIDSTTNKREDISKIVLHNELVDDKYVRNIGIQQWISDYLVSEKLSITNIANRIRNSEVCLGYRCAGFYQQGTVDIFTDTYGELPDENVHIDLFESKRERVMTYSGMTVTKSKRGYVIDGFDVSYPYFRVRMPDKGGKKSTITVNEKVFYYYHQYKKNVTEIPYGTEYTSMQDVYDVIIAYGRYLTENENWYFSTLSPEGLVLDFRTSGESFARWATSLKGEEAENALILLNPGSLGIGNYNDGMVYDVNKKISGYVSVKDVYGNPFEENVIDAYRQSFNTYFYVKEGNQIALLKFRTYDLEHLITFDNETIYKDVLYNSVYSAQIERFKLYGVKVLNWYGTLYAPGYIVRNDGAIPNYDKTVNDLQYMFDVDDVHCQGQYDEYSRGIVGYKKTKTYQDLYKNEKSMFDFYKGAIRHKGTKNVLKKMNRSTNISSSGNEIELYEQWAFREGKFGHIKDNSVDEFILDKSKMIQNPQIITFETATDYYYDMNKIYNSGDICIYNNYEYVATRNNISGAFNSNKWKQLRYVGNYIIFNEDPNWIKKSNTLKVNCFKYTDNLLINPIGGFAKTEECSYIVVDDAAANELLDTIEVGENVWVVKTALGDWDVRKKTGVNKYVSMRYFTIEDAVKQPSEVFVYHFKDDQLDYYTKKNSENIDIPELLYNDIDINNIECKWGDIEVPTYTGNNGEHITGTDYKVKMFNTVFTTMVQADELNNGVPLKDIYSGQNVSYSSLLLHMTQFGKTEYSYKWLFQIQAVDKDNGKNLKDVKIIINGNTYNPTADDDFMVELIVSEGDVLNWSVSARGCGERHGTVEFPKVIENPTTEDKKRPSKLIVPLSYRKDTVIYQSKSGRDSEPIIFEEGEYEVKLVGAGGGGGGGCTCRKKRHSCGGCAGPSGAYLHGMLTITNSTKTSDDNKYTITTGKGGVGGVAGHHVGGVGSNGGDSAILLNGKSIIYAQGGAAGLPGVTKHGRGNPRCGNRACGYGGILQSYFTILFEKDPDSRNGINGCFGAREGNPGASVYPTGNYGKGGGWRYRGKGTSGIDGLGEVVFKSANDMVDYNVKLEPSKALPISTEVSTTDSYEYSSYNQPYVVPYNGDDDIKYFYSYDVIHEDEIRPDANIVGPSSAFYYNRAKSVTAYHKDSVVKNLWKPNYTYNVGDTVTVVRNYVGTYYICVNTVTQSEFYPTNGESGDKEVVYWEEYAPTYYYKITYNGQPVPKDEEHPENNPTDPRYDNGSYELYEDAQCTIRATKNNEDEIDNDRLMNCSDLDFERTISIGNEYTLVDKFATYSQLIPTYLREPSWGSINQVGTYEIISGGISYFVNSNKATIEADKESLVYTNPLCTNPPVQSVKPVIVNDVLTYETVDMKYTHIINTQVDHKEVSYEYKDKDTYLWSSKNQDQIELETPMYREQELENQLGVYKDYIPVWEKVTSLPNSYSNTISTMKYTAKNEEITGMKVYNVSLSDNNGKNDFFYESGLEMKPLYGVSYYNYDGTVPSDIGQIYYINDGTQDVYDADNDLPTSGITNNYIIKVLIDKVNDLSNSYYQYQNNDWVLLGTYNNIKTNSNYFKRINGTLNCELEEPNESILYPEITYTKNEISNNDSITDNGSNANILIYFNEQSVGRHLETGNLIENANITEDITFFNYDTNEDETFKAVKYMADNYEFGKTSEELFNEYISQGSLKNKIFYVDENEVIERYSELEFIGDRPDISSYESSIYEVHNCQVYNMYRNVNGKIEYTKLYLYGNKFYSRKLVSNDFEDTIISFAVYCGDMDSLTTYEKIDYTYSEFKTYEERDVCEYNNIAYECISETSGEFKLEHWKLYERDKIVNVITYKDINDIVYITSDNLNNRVIDNTLYVSDTNSCMKQNGLVCSTDKNGWMKLKYIDQDCMFDFVDLERKRLAVDTIKSCYLVNNENDGTIVEVQVFDPIQNIIPNNVLMEINYISSTDPVNDYNDAGKWSDSKVGFLWWDTSKVRYIDYYQGDYEYRRNNWGKQLPGSEIAIMEWTRDVTPPDVDTKYVERSTYNVETSTIETYYYYWKKNPIDIPEATFRKTSAFHIAEIINDPTKEGIVWMSPIDANVSGRNDNTLIIANTSNVVVGQEAVLQLNTDSDKDIMDHTEWAMVKENTNDDIPEFLWEKMTDSLLGYKTIDGVDMSVPAEDLVGRQRLGIAFRPRQTMFDNVYNARKNFIDAINDVFNTRTEEEMMVDLASGLDSNVEGPENSPYYYEKENGEYIIKNGEKVKIDEAGTMLELMSWKDQSLIGRNILVRHDETHDNIWVIYHINKGFTYSVLDYEKYDIRKYITYNDWYKNREITYMSPVYIEKTSETIAKKVASGQQIIPGYGQYIKEGELVRFENEDGWIIYQNIGENDSEIVGRSKSVMEINKSIYDYVNEGIDNTESYIELYKENNDGSLELVRTITKYDYVYEETQELIKILIDYIDVESDE